MNKRSRKRNLTTPPKPARFSARSMIAILDSEPPPAWRKSVLVVVCSKTPVSARLAKPSGSPPDRLGQTGGYVVFHLGEPKPPAPRQRMADRVDGGHPHPARKPAAHWHGFCGSPSESSGRSFLR